VTRPVTRYWAGSQAASRPARSLRTKGSTKNQIECSIESLFESLIERLLGRPSSRSVEAPTARRPAMMTARRSIRTDRLAGSSRSNSRRWARAAAARGVRRGSAQDCDRSSRSELRSSAPRAVGRDRPGDDGQPRPQWARWPWVHRCWNCGLGPWTTSLLGSYGSGLIRGGA